MSAMQFEGMEGGSPGGGGGGRHQQGAKEMAHHRPPQHDGGYAGCGMGQFQQSSGKGEGGARFLKWLAYFVPLPTLSVEMTKSSKNLLLDRRICFDGKNRKMDNQRQHISSDSAEMGS